MSAGDDQANGWKDDRSVGQPIGVNVTFEMIDAYDRETTRESSSFRGVGPDEERADQARAIGWSYAGQIIPAESRVGEGALDRWYDRENMLSGRNLGNDPAKRAVNVHLGGDNARHDLSPLSND
jgi:hypothetical protein